MVGLQPGDLISQLPDQPVGGVFLAGHTTRGADELSTGIATLQRSVTRSAGVPAQVAVDQEGGYVQSLAGPDFPAIPTAVAQGEESSSDLADGTSDWAKRLVDAGITLDLAPVADVVPAGTAEENPPIGAQDRQYGSSPSAVAEAVVTVIRSMLGVKLGTTVKHFPGLGRVRANTDTSADAVDAQTSASDPALQPFRAAIAAHTTAVMISSATYPQLDPDHIAAFSAAIVTDLLRQKLHFDGLVISDDLGGAVAVSSFSPGQRAVDFVRAGGDMVLTVQVADIAPMTAALASLAARDKTFRARVDNAALHVLASKQSVGLLSCG
ncbi:beta-N-acetylhexosaminidase [Nakamurella panacisegetis]|uniref:Beta-N-acetylhexosaminidase n=2 Tax=Nakamurella panacisegetis TaxID=1090615 RepID=A0A1H0KV13_9ACTN|nr:beta-N-acetylhexosaminidase [Nakamurella panacisegetis]